MQMHKMSEYIHSQMHFFLTFENAPNIFANLQYQVQNSLPYLVVLKVDCVKSLTLKVRSMFEKWCSSLFDELVFDTSLASFFLKNEVDKKYDEFFYFFPQEINNRKMFG